MQKIIKEVYLSNDGIEFDNAIDAIRQDNKNTFITNYEYGTDGLWANDSKVDGDKLATWLLDNQKQVLQLLA